MKKTISIISHRTKKIVISIIIALVVIAIIVGLAVGLSKKPSASGNTSGNASGNTSGNASGNTSGNASGNTSGNTTTSITNTQPSIPTSAMITVGKLTGSKVKNCDLFSDTMAIDLGKLLIEPKYKLSKNSTPLLGLKYDNTAILHLDLLAIIFEAKFIYPFLICRMTDTEKNSETIKYIESKTNKNGVNLKINNQQYYLVRYDTYTGPNETGNMFEMNSNLELMPIKYFSLSASKICYYTTEELNSGFISSVLSFGPNQHIFDLNEINKIRAVYNL